MALRIDRAGEFTSKQFYSYCEEFGIKHQLTAQYTLEQNGVAEHKNRTLVEMARCLLKQRGLPTDLQVEAIVTAVYLRNKSPTRALEDCTPYEAITNTKPSMKHLRVFICLAFVYINSQQRTKFDPKSEKKGLHWLQLRVKSL